MLKTVTKELRYAHDVISSGETHSARVGAVVDPLLGLFLEGGQITGTGDVQKGVTGWIRQEASLAETAEKAHLAEVRQLDQIREERDADEEVLYRKCLTVRATVESAAGKGKSAQLVGLDPRLSRVGSQTLRRYGRVALEILEDPEFASPDGAVDGVGIKPQETADDIRPVLERFESTLERFERQQRRVEETQRLKDEALARLRLVAINGAKILEGFYNLAGEKFHAERLRRKRARAQASSPEEPSSPEEASSEEPGETPRSRRAKRSQEQMADVSTAGTRRPSFLWHGQTSGQRPARGPTRRPPAQALRSHCPA